MKGFWNSKSDEVIFKTFKVKDLIFIGKYRIFSTGFSMWACGKNYARRLLAVKEAGAEAKAEGEKLISIELQQMDGQQTARALPMLNKVRRGERDVFV